jgi:hypothetical protein
MFGSPFSPPHVAREHLLRRSFLALPFRAKMPFDDEWLKGVRFQTAGNMQRKFGFE